MGRKIDHACEQCGFSAHVSGKPDAGLLAGTDTIRCTECGALHDRVTEVWEKGSEENVAPEPCPACGAPGDQALPWRTGDPCPGCGDPLHATGPLMTIWD